MATHCLGRNRVVLQVIIIILFLKYYTLFFTTIIIIIEGKILKKGNYLRFLPSYHEEFNKERILKGAEEESKEKKKKKKEKRTKKRSFSSYNIILYIILPLIITELHIQKIRSKREYGERKGVGRGWIVRISLYAHTLHSRTLRHTGAFSNLKKKTSNKKSFTIFICAQI